MIQKHIPSRRFRPARPNAERPAGSSLYKPKRVRAGGTPAKPRKRRVPGQGPAAAAPPPVAPELSEKQRRHLRGLAHDLKPLIRLRQRRSDRRSRNGNSPCAARSRADQVKAPAAAIARPRDALFAELAKRTASAFGAPHRQRGSLLPPQRHPAAHHDPGRQRLKVPWLTRHTA